MTEQPIADRGSNRSHRPTSEAFKKFVMSEWGGTPEQTVPRADVADYAAERRRKLGQQFPGERLVIPAGGYKVRANDTDYRFRPHSAFAHLTGLGTDQEPDAVLVLHPTDGGEHEAVLYFRPASGRETEEFYMNARLGEFWVGRRPTLAEIEQSIGITTKNLDELEDGLTKDVGGEVSLRVIPDVDEAVSELVAKIREQSGAGETEQTEHISADEELLQAASELRLVKDEWEVQQLREAVAATIAGFERIVRELPRAMAHRRGERVVEATFDGNAREEGNGVGYETIAASGEHATTLHWIRNNGEVNAGDLLLVDAGVEVESLYTADITRTLPVSGTYSEVQRKVYEAVVDAADAATEIAVPGTRFRDVHEKAMEVIAQRLEEWGLLPVSAAESLSPDGQQHRRWIVHGVSHHVGLDVHDCAQARAEMYMDAQIEPGMVFTVEPGLYFKPDDMTVPAEFRGIGARCEDDILITEDGNERLSAALPRRAGDIERWMREL